MQVDPNAEKLKSTWTDEIYSPKLSRSLSVRNVLHVLSPRCDRRASLQEIKALRTSQDADVKGKALFSIVLQDSLNEQQPEFLSGQEGDVITLMRVENKDTFVARNGSNVGKVVASTLGIDVRHAPNLYLEVAHALIEHPDLLAVLMTRDYPEMPDQKSCICQMFRARKLLPKALRVLFAHELLKADTKDKKASLFREQSPCIALSTAVFETSGAMTTFRSTFILHVKDLIKGIAGEKKCTLVQIAEVLQQSIDGLVEIPDALLPSDLLVVLGSLKQEAKEEFSQGYLSVLLGTLLFLRYICPGFYLNPPVSEDMRAVAKALQLISNQTEPNVDSEYYEIREQLEALHKPLAGFLLKAASLPTPKLKAPSTELVSQAASIYWLASKEGKRFDRKSQVKATLDVLKKRLGNPPKGPIADESKVAKSKEIEEIAKILSDMSL